MPTTPTIDAVSYTEATAAFAVTVTTTDGTAIGLQRRTDGGAWEGVPYLTSYDHTAGTVVVSDGYATTRGSVEYRARTYDSVGDTWSAFSTPSAPVAVAAGWRLRHGSVPSLSVSVKPVRGDVSYGKAGAYSEVPVMGGEHPVVYADRIYISSIGLPPLQTRGRPEHDLLTILLDSGERLQLAFDTGETFWVVVPGGYDVSERGNASRAQLPLRTTAVSFTVVGGPQ